MTETHESGGADHELGRMKRHGLHFHLRKLHPGTAPILEIHWPSHRPLVEGCLPRLYQWGEAPPRC